jgi:hypothetical protein
VSSDLKPRLAPARDPEPDPAQPVAAPMHPFVQRRLDEYRALMVKGRRTGRLVMDLNYAEGEEMTAWVGIQEHLVLKRGNVGDPIPPRRPGGKS